MDSRTDPTYVSWLQDALVMEQTLIKVLEERVASTGDFPEVRSGSTSVTSKKPVRTPLVSKPVWIVWAAGHRRPRAW